MKAPLSPDIILCSRLGSENQLTNSLTISVIVTSPELIAEALEKYQNKDMETESEPTEDYDVSVFDTITSLMGKEITRSIQRRDRSPPEGKESAINNNSHGDAESRQPLLPSPDLLQTQAEVSGGGIVGTRLCPPRLFIYWLFIH